MNLKILLLPGDGIGAEVTGAAVEVLKAVAKKFGHTLELTEGLARRHRDPQDRDRRFPKDTMDKALAADATLMGAVGLPEFDNCSAQQAARRGLLGIRAVLDVFANLRPVRTWPALIESSPLKNHVVEGTDMIIVRELTGGLVLRPAARHRRRSRVQHDVLHARGNRAGHAHGVSSWRANRRKKADQRRQVQRARSFAVLAEGGDRSRARSIRTSSWSTCWWTTPRCRLVLRPTQFDVMLTENTVRRYSER